jgi:Calcineurin-like phosphoesterase
MSKTYIIIPDSHAHPDFTNERADWLSKLIIDVKPDVVINIGDQFDMSSLSSYDKGKRDFHGRSYKKDIESGVEFSDRVWGPVKDRKKKLPYRVVLEGNHEHRVERALDLSPELAGTIGFKDYQYDEYYDEVVRYNGSTPGVFELDDILFAHYFITGVSGRPIGGERPAHMLIDKTGQSAIAGHLHTLDYATRTNVAGRTRSGLVCGCYQDYNSPWAGEINHLWRAGIPVLRNVEMGYFDFQWIGLDALRNEYSV